jgi:glycosyltransferase involved in cell wall biosynthesis
VKVLTFTTLYPNVEQPRHGIFVDERLRHLRDGHSKVESLVMAPIPWFPSGDSKFGTYGAYARVPERELRHGITVLHPRYPAIPKVGMSVAPLLMAAALYGKVAALRQQTFHFDLIDAHFIYPDGVAAAIIARRLGVPVALTARGTDISLLPHWRIPRASIRWALRNADAVVGVCAALTDAMKSLEPTLSNPYVMRNGVDLVKFRPLPREPLRAELGLSGFTLISVGHAIERKGHHLLIDAMRALPEATLLIAGDGPMDVALKRQAQEQGVADRVRFLGPIPHAELVNYYCAADALVLASSREGWANVLLEAMACGTPVVATAIWGTPEVVQVPEAGILVKERSPAAIAAAVRELMADYPDRRLTRAYAERFSWDETSHSLMHLFETLIAEHTAR